jgi:anti-anti-sigma factor
MNSSRLAIDHETRGELDVLDVQGELDLTNADAIESALARTRCRTVVLDLGLLVFVDSAGIRAIDLAHRGLTESGRRLLVVAPPESRAAWTFRVAGFDSNVVLGSLEAAMNRALADDAATDGGGFRRNDGREPHRR